MNWTEFKSKCKEWEWIPYRDRVYEIQMICRCQKMPLIGYIEAPTINAPKWYILRMLPACYRLGNKEVVVFFGTCDLCGAKYWTASNKELIEQWLNLPVKTDVK